MYGFNKEEGNPDFLLNDVTQYDSFIINFTVFNCSFLIAFKLGF